MKKAWALGLISLFVLSVFGQPNFEAQIIDTYGHRLGQTDAIDMDGDGDLDLFKGGVEPFIHSYENVGGNRFVDRGRLTSGGKLFTLPKNDHNNRSWVVPHFYDWDKDGALDFFPSFMSGPYAGRGVWFSDRKSVV